MIMKKVFLLLAVGISATLITFSILKKSEKKPEKPHVRSTFSPKGSKEEKAGREEYFFNMLRDPATNSIPEGIRAKELSFAKELDKKYQSRMVSVGFDWKEAGPNDVGGRTRAIGIDIRNSNIIIAGGVSGGIYRSEDNGNSWTLVNNPDEYNGITSIAQDTREGHQNTWYYSTGEFTGNSASARGWSAGYYGNGLYKSTDNGISWNLITGTNSNQAKWDSDYDYVSKIKVNPVTGSIFICSNGIGIIKLNEGGDSNSAQIALGKVNGYYWSDVDIHNNGTIIAFLSKDKPNNGTQTKEPGVYISKDDGSTFTLVTKPNSFPANYDRGLVRIAPSNKDVAYLFVVNNNTPYFYKINLASNTMEDRSSNVRQEFQGSTSWLKEKLGKQGDYNMTLAIHPTDEDFVIVGSTSLFRSKDGFATQPNVYYTWIGGYGNPSTKSFQHPNHHPDCHITIFDQNNPNEVWSGHDGGLSYCQNIKTETSSSSYIIWKNKNRGYNITQFYNVAINHTAEGNEYIGGAQDNGSPYFEFNGASTTTSQDASSGDGAYCALTNNNIFASSQYGNVIRNSKSGTWTKVNPSDLEDDDKLFIHPYIIDQNDNNVMYYPSKNNLWVNSNVSEIPDYQQDGSMINWINFEVSPDNYTITTLAASIEPKSIIYLGTYDKNSNPEFYKIERPIDNNRIVTKINISDASLGSYPHDIAINPENADEFIVVMSNYNIKGLYHSLDGGKNYTCIEGNLEGTIQNPGPSLRCAAINVKSDVKKYFVGTSTGLYYTETIDGDNTIWTKVEKNLIGSVIVNDIDLNHINGNMAIGTHGRGIFAALNRNLPIFLSNPLPNIIETVSEKEIIIRKSLLDVFEGESIIKHELISNSNKDLLSATIEGSDIVITIKPNKYGSSQIEFKGSSNSNSLHSTLGVEIVAPLVSIKKMISDYSINIGEKSNIEIDLSDIFINGDNYRLRNNTNSSLVSYSLNSSVLSLNIASNKTGEAKITVESSNNFNTVSQEFKIIVSKATAIDNSLSDKFTVYPNPTNGLSYIKIGDSKLIGHTITIINSKGQTILTERITNLETAIDITNKPNGIYFVKIQNENSIGTKKIVKR